MSGSGFWLTGVPPGLYRPAPAAPALAGSARAEGEGVGVTDGYIVYALSAAEEPAALDAIEQAGGSCIVADLGPGRVALLTDVALPGLTGRAATRNEAGLIGADFLSRPGSGVRGPWRGEMGYDA